jgi:putative endonuclease
VDYIIVAFGAWYLGAMAYYVYMLLCKDKTIYTGIATDVERRFAEHRAGKGGRYTRSHPVAKIAYIELCGTRGDALRREFALKRLSKTHKIELIHG